MMGHIRIFVALGALTLASCTSQLAEAGGDCATLQRQFLEQHQPGRLQAASDSFIRLAHSCPASLKGPLRDYVQYFVSDVKRDSKLRETHYQILRTLFATGWTAIDGVEPDPLWVDLAQRHLEHGDFPAAKLAAQKVFLPESLLKMRIDRRFDAVVKADPSRFDMAAAHERSIERLRTVAAEAPRSLYAQMQLAYGLRSAGQYHEGLHIANSALSQGKQAFDDYAAQYPWMLTVQGWLMFDMRRVDEAIAALEAAERYTRDTPEYVNFAINLGIAQVVAARPDAALATLAKAGNGNERGNVLIQIGIASACLQIDDQQCATDALRKAREDRAGAYGYYVGALLRAGQLDAARDLLLQRLRNPDLRGEALVEVQNYTEPPPLPAQRDEVAQRSKLLALPEIQKAILEVGRIESFEFPEP